MKNIHSQTPVIVGVGFAQEHDDDPTRCAEAIELMVRAARSAAADAGSDDLLRRVESISVPQGLWQYRNPGALVAEALGCPQATSIISDLGVLQLTLLSDLCSAIAGGEQDVGLIVGGEAKYRELRAQVTGQPVAETVQGEEVARPQVHHASSDPFCSDLEAQRGLMSPAELFSIIESALRHQRGWSVDEHRDRVADLYREFSEIAAANPHAWRRQPVSAAEIRDPVGKNAMLAFPYTKLHCSQWNVNQAVALLVCSAAVAERLGVARERWIFPVSAAQSRHVVVLAQQRQLHSHRGTVLCGERALALADASLDDVAAAELYSCFPAAIQSFARDLGVEGRCAPTVTGAMSFAGGPFNHFSLYGVARMVEVLRSWKGERRFGLVSNLSGIFGKQGCALFSTEPNPNGYAFEDVTDAAAAQDPPVPIDAAYSGPATIAGYTVVYKRGEPSHAIAICDTPAGERTVARSDERALIEKMTQQEFCGRRVEIAPDGEFAI